MKHGFGHAVKLVAKLRGKEVAAINREGSKPSPFVPGLLVRLGENR